MRGPEPALPQPKIPSSVTLSDPSAKPADSSKSKTDGPRKSKQPTLHHPGEGFDSGPTSPALTAKGARPAARSQQGQTGGGGAGSDLFARKAQVQPKAVSKPTLATPPGPLPPPSPSSASGARYVLDSAKDPGVYFQEDQQREGHSEEDEDPELRAAVEECIAMLFGVRGIHNIGPGRNEVDEPVIVIAVGPGFGETSFGRIPPSVGRFKTLLALPYEQLPLRRDRAS